MRNLKKILALVLAMVMTLSVMSVAGAFSDDKDFNGDYNEAAQVLSALKVYQGYPDGSFQPKASITRAEVAAVIYRIATGDVKDANKNLYKDYNKFTDVPSNKWYAGYVNYCANAEYIRGNSATTFAPEENVTGYQALAMILRAVGYDQNKEWTGKGWEVKVASTAKQLGITDNLSGVTLGQPVSREVVAEILFQAIQVPTVTYTPAFGYTNITIGAGRNQTLGYKVFKLVGSVSEDDVWGHPAKVWKLDSNSNAIAESSDKTLCSIAVAPVATYWVATKECDIASALGLNGNKEYAYTTYTNGKVNVSTTNINPVDTVNTVGAQGRLVEVYKDRIVMIDTLLAQVTNVTNAVFDNAGHLAREASITLAVYDTNTTTTAGGTHSPIVNTTTYTLVTETNGDENYPYAAGDMVLVNAVQYTTGRVRANADQYVEILQKADTLVGAQTVIWYNASQHTVNGTVYSDNNRFHLDQAGIDTTNHTWYFDTQGNLIGATDIANQYTYGIVSNIYWTNTNGVGEAHATITYMDGTTAEAKIATIDRWVEASTSTVAHYVEDCKPVYALAGAALGINETAKTVGISTWAVDNKAMFGDDLYQITTLTDGSLKLDAVKEMTGSTVRTGVSLVSGTAGKASTATKIYTNSNTQYLVKTGSNKYTPITGFNNIYSYTNKNGNGYALVDYVVGGDGYVAYAYVQGTPDVATSNKLVYVTGNQYQTYVDDNAITHYVVNAVNIDGTATTVETTNYTGVVVPLFTNVGKLYYVSYTGDEATAVSEVTETTVGGGKDVSAAYGDNMVAMVMDGAYLIGDVLTNNAQTVRVNTTKQTVYAGDIANIRTHLVYVLVNKATTYVTGVYVSTLDATAATPATATLALPAGETDVRLISNAGLNVFAGQTVTNVALVKTTGNWAKQGDASYIVSATDGTNAWIVTNVRVVGQTMTFDLTAPAVVTAGSTVTLSWVANP